MDSSNFSEKTLKRILDSVQLSHLASVIEASTISRNKSIPFLIENIFDIKRALTSAVVNHTILDEKTKSDPSNMFFTLASATTMGIVHHEKGKGVDNNELIIEYAYLGGNPYIIGIYQDITEWEKLVISTQEEDVRIDIFQEFQRFKEKESKVELSAVLGQLIDLQEYLLARVKSAVE